MLHNRVMRALVPLTCAVFSTGIAAVICLELAEAMSDLPTHLQITVYAVPVIYWIVSALTLFGVIGKDGAVVLSLILIPVFIVFEMFILGFVIHIGIDGIG